jgi:hypothetical protein
MSKVYFQNETMLQISNRLNDIIYYN